MQQWVMTCVMFTSLTLFVLPNVFLSISPDYLFSFVPPRAIPFNEDAPDAFSKIPSNSSIVLNQKNHASSGICNGKKGILLIRRGDGESAVGTLFFSYIINHLIYAEQNNLVPWIHLDPSFPCYDESVHGNETTLHFVWPIKAQESRIVGKGDMECLNWRKEKTKSHYPGPIVSERRENETFALIGNGIWQSYFEPLSEPVPIHDPSCSDKPLLFLQRRSVFPGLHVCAPWAVRSWPFLRIPKAVRPQASIRDWYSPMRKRGAAIVAKYYRPRPWLKELVEKTNPTKNKCLSMHIRLTDKADGRTKPPLTVFQLYAEAYAEASSGGSIYIATDDGTIFERIRKEWKGIKEIITQKNVLRSSGKAAIFRRFTNETHRTNSEGLVDIYAMSRCDFFVHGFSAMAEATIFINPPLHNRSINVDVVEEERMTGLSFEKMVREFYRKDTK